MKLFNKKINVGNQVILQTNSEFYIKLSKKVDRIETFKAIRDILLVKGVSPIIVNDIEDHMVLITQEGRPGTFLKGFLYWRKDRLIYQRHSDNIEQEEIVRIVPAWEDITKVIEELVIEQGSIIMIETKNQPIYIYNDKGNLNVRSE